MIELLYQQPGITIFFIIWITGILNYIIRKDDNILDLAISYSVLYGVFKVLLYIIGVR